MYKVKEVLTSPESALLLNEIYSMEYCDRVDAPAENVFSDTLIRNNELISDFNMLKVILNEYTELDIGKFFKISYVEYKNMTTYERGMVNDTAIELIKKADAEYKNLKDRNEGAYDKIRNIELEDIYN